MKSATIEMGRGIFVTLCLNPTLVLVTAGKLGSMESNMSLAIQTLVNKLVASGRPLHEVAEGLTGIFSREPWYYDGDKCLSVPDAVGKGILRLMEDEWLRTETQ